MHPSVPRPVISSTKKEVDHFFVMQMYAKGKTLPLSEVQGIIQRALRLFAMEPNLIYLEDPVCVVGDLHGQLADLYKVLELGGSFETMKFLFLGDYVDRGLEGLEILIILFALKARYPNQIFLLRGNHETRNATSNYGFREECNRKYNHEIWIQIMSLFDKLPLAAVINGHFFAVHGGISPELIMATDLNRVNREIEPPIHGIVTDLIWSDPGKEIWRDQWEFNDQRGCGVLFGKDETLSFLKDNGLNMILRAHQCVDSGFECETYGLDTPKVVTLFSAEDYCGSKNLGAMLRIKGNSLNVIQFDFGLKGRDMLFQEYGGVFEWTAPLIDHFLFDILDGFFEFTNDALDSGESREVLELSPADLAELGIKASDFDFIEPEDLSRTERSIEDRKRKSRLSSTLQSDMFKTLSVSTLPQKISNSLISLGEAPEEVFAEVIEQKRSDYFRKAAEELQVNQDAIFASFNLGQAHAKRRSITNS